MTDLTRESVEAELAAAKAVAAKIGLGSIEPQILKLAKHTTARLAPLPILARIQSAASPDQAYANASREVTVAAHLSARGAPAVRVARNIAPGPHVENGCVITLWDFLEGQPAQSDVDAAAAARSLRQVHEGLAGIDVDLPPFTDAIDTCEAILADTASAPRLKQADRDFLKGLYADLRQDLGRRELSCRPLHGDTHLANVLITNSGATWLDLEAVCSGPLEWDVGMLPSATWPEFGDLDRDLVRLLKDLSSLCVATWCWADFERGAEVAEAAVHHLDTLRGRFSDD